MTKARTLADMISDGVIGTTELADDVITPVKLDETGNYSMAQLGVGTASPAKRLHISTTTGTDLFRLSGVNNFNFDIESSGTGNQFDFRIGSGGGVYTFNNSNRELVKFDASGNVILNSTSVSTSDNIALRITGGSSGYSNVQFADAGDVNVGMIQYNHAANYMQFTTNDSERMRIRSDGNIHINTTTPDLVGNTTSLTIGGSSFGGDGMLSLQSGWGGTTYGRVFASGGQLKIGNPQNGQVSFYSANLTRLNIRADGDLEIFNTQSAGGGNETNALYWKIQNSANTGQYARLGGISAETVSNWGGDLLFHSKPANATPNDTTEERMRIMYDGRVCFLGGAGVANPKIMTYKFSGVGNGDTMNLSNTLRFSGLVMVGSDGNDTAAYVFAVADDSYYGQASTTQIIGESNTAYTYQTLSLSSPINSNLVLTASGSNTKNYVVMLIGVN